MIAGGQIIPVLRKLTPSNNDVNVIWELLRHAVHPMDFVVLTLLGWGTVPLFRILYYTCYSSSTATTSSSSSKSSSSPSTTTTTTTTSTNGEKGGGGLVRNNGKALVPPTSLFDDDFRCSYMFHISNHIAQAARLAILVYMVDCLTVVLTGLGFSFNHLSNLSLGFAKILYIVWAAQRLSVFKRYLLGRAFSRHPGKLGQAAIVDRLMDGIIYIVTGLFLMDILDVEMGVGVSSIFAFGSAGTLVVGLASKDVASMFVSGLTLTTTDHVREGDHVKFGDGTTGQIVRIGWMHTTIRGYDELIEVVRIQCRVVSCRVVSSFGGDRRKQQPSIPRAPWLLDLLSHTPLSPPHLWLCCFAFDVPRTKKNHQVPNSVLGMQRVKNISRLNMCQVKENLRLRYDDATKIPQCCADILQEIQQSCPDVITDGTRPLRAVWRGYEKDHLVVMVDVHFLNIKPIGTVRVLCAKRTSERVTGLDTDSPPRFQYTTTPPSHPLTFSQM